MTRPLREAEAPSLSDNLAAQVVQWQVKHGRNHLPWQNTRDPYKVWLSEVMLQQTQVVTVLGYFERFTTRFPNVQALAAAPLDDVLALWSGLGYYSRARNLHACASQVVFAFGGSFPRDAKTLQTLPGIGRSTAGAIASLCFGERVAILDGNVKRVLTRVMGFDADLSIAANEKALWDQATDVLPQTDLLISMQRYTQGMMDLGATVCSAKNPTCKLCPVTDLCVAQQQGEQEKYPVKTRKIKRSSQSLWLLWVQSKSGAVFLSKRPTPGVWAGLYCFAVFDSRESLVESVSERFHNRLIDAEVVKHVLTHKDLHLHPVCLTAPQGDIGLAGGQWFSLDEAVQLGLPAPVRKLLLAGQPTC